MHVIVVGAGIIGALTAYQLVRTGAKVTVIEAGQPASAASGASFGWINASFFLDKDHFALRAAAMEAHRRLGKDLKSTATVWQGCLCWEEQGAAFDAQHTALTELGYTVREVDRASFAALEPQITAPDRALCFEREGAVDLNRLCHDALNAATSLGARIVAGIAATGIAQRAGRVTGIRWSGGVIPADRVLLATGVKTQELLAGVDVDLPMLDRPGLILRTHPLPPLLSHILVAPGQELRQDRAGRLLAPTAASHQSDETEKISENPISLADAAADRVGHLIGRDVLWEQVTLAHRPVPADGRPVIGSGGPDGLYVTTMHSGATLAPLAAEIAACEVLGTPLSNEMAALVAPYRPERFGR